MTKPVVMYDFDGTIANSFLPTIRVFNALAPRLGFEEISVD